MTLELMTDYLKELNLEQGIATEDNSIVLQGIVNQYVDDVDDNESDSSDLEVTQETSHLKTYKNALEHMMPLAIFF